jgi:kynurenine formamidase
MAELTKDDVARMFEELKNWGRWGADDERGTLNLITAAKTKAALALARDGVTVSCALPLPVAPAPENPRPVAHMMLRAGDAVPETGLAFTADYFGIASHGMATSHLDALCHVVSNGKVYNGFDKSEVRSDGAQKLSIMSGKDGLVSRGVLLDLPGLRGKEWLEPGERITRADLDAAEQRQGVRVEAGDILLVWTGRDARREALGPWPLTEGLAGLYADCLPWLRERDIAILGCDGVSDAIPSGIEGSLQPIHEVIIASMGVHILDNLCLHRLAAECRSRNRYAFLLMLGPLRLERGTASPVNPIAVF